MERAKGIEPSALAWEARVLPLYDAREGRYSTTLRRFSTTPNTARLRRDPPTALAAGVRHRGLCTVGRAGGWPEQAPAGRKLS